MIPKSLPIPIAMILHLWKLFWSHSKNPPQKKPQKQHASPKMVLVDYFLVVRTVSGLKFAHLVLDFSFIPTLTAERHPKKPWPFLSVKLQRMRMANTGIDVTFWSMGYAATVACPSRDPPAFLGMGCGGCWLEECSCCWFLLLYKTP